MSAIVMAPRRRRGMRRRGGWSRRPGGVEALGHGPCVLAALRADHAARQVVGLDVDPAPDPGLAGLVGGVVVRRPLEPDVRRGALFEFQRALLDRVAADTTREVLAAGK